MGITRRVHNTANCHFSFLNFFLVVFTGVLIGGCSFDRGPEITIHWSQPKPQIKAGAPIKYTGINIGEVREVDDEVGGTLVRAKLFSKYAHYVRVETSFLAREAENDEGAFIEAISTDRNSRIAKDGEVFKGTESMAETMIKTAITNWKLTLIWLVILFGGLLFIVKISKVFFAFFGLVLCVFTGILSSIFLTGVIDHLLNPLFPQEVRTDLIAYGVAFILGYLGGTILYAIFKKPVARKAN